jgi:hypothetical protein
VSVCTLVGAFVDCIVAACPCRVLYASLTETVAHDRRRRQRRARARGGAELINIALANWQQRMDQSDHVSGQLVAQNIVIYRRHKMSARYIEHLGQIQRRTHRILSVLATQAAVELHVDDEHGDEGASPWIHACKHFDNDKHKDVSASACRLAMLTDGGSSGTHG